MRLLRASECASIPLECTFRPGRAGPTVLCLLLWGLLAVPVLARADLQRLASSIPWFAWVLAGPLFAIALLLGVLVLHGTAEFAVNAWRKSAWIAATSWDGVYLNLRSWQNAHFPDDGPTVAFVPWTELDSVHVVVERVDPGTTRSAPSSRKWIALALRGVDTRELERRLHAEAARPGPERRWCGISMRSRYHHTPVIVPKAGVVQVEWTTAGFLRELALRVQASPTPELTRIAEPARSLEERVAELVQRGDPLSAVELARRAGGLSLLEAKELVERVGRRAA
ncbi:MAG: hypothetical protein HZA53_02740 [Planctomycetes bacterium]|nr:hypothetical protein [Planctomycetota bacterium]